MTKRILSILTAVMLFCSMAMPIASAEGEKTYGDFQYEVDHGAVRILAYNGNDTHVVIPAKIEGKTVTYLASRSFFGHKSIQTIDLPNTLTYIGSEVFGKCTGLKEIRIPNSVTVVGKGAFKKCTALTSVTLPKNLTSLSKYLFWDCTALERVELPEKLESIKRVSFKNCISLKKLTLPKSLTSIAGGSFINTPNLKLKLDKKNKSFKLKNGVLFSKDGTRLIKYTKAAPKNYVIPQSVKTVAYDAFSYSHIQKVTLQKGVTVNASAFEHCVNLKEVRIKKGVKRIGWAFDKCANLKKIIVLDQNVDLHVSNIGEYYDEAGKHVNVPNIKIYAYKGSKAQEFVRTQNEARKKADRIKFIAL